MHCISIWSLDHFFVNSAKYMFEIAYHPNRMVTCSRTKTGIDKLINLDNFLIIITHTRTNSLKQIFLEKYIFWLLAHIYTIIKKAHNYVNLCQTFVRSVGQTDGQSAKPLMYVSTYMLLAYLENWNKNKQRRNKQANKNKYRYNKKSQKCITSQCTREKQAS